MEGKKIKQIVVGIQGATLTLENLTTKEIAQVIAELNVVLKKPDYSLGEM